MARSGYDAALVSTESRNGPVAAPIVERRADERVVARIEVRFKGLAEAARAFRAYSLNLSAGGLCLKTRRQYQVGERLSLSLTLEKQEYHLTGVVAWERSGAVGVRFENVTSEDRQRLGEVVERYRAGKPLSPSPSRR